MTKLVDIELSTRILEKARKLIETRGWWKGIDGDLRGAIDINGHPVTAIEDPKNISGYTLGGALLKAKSDYVKHHKFNQLSPAYDLVELFLGAAIRKSTDLSLSPDNLGKVKDMSMKRVLSIIKEAQDAINNQWKKGK